MPGSVAVVTGGAGGMGLATARILGHDHTVVISDVKQEALTAAISRLTASGVTAQAVVADITDRASVDALAVAGEGLALVNVASIAGYMTPSLIVPRRTYRLALTDPEAFAARLARAASRGPRNMGPGAAYSLSKNFVIWYTAKMAGAFGARGARILSVSPGSFDTAMGRLEEKSGSGKLIEHAALKRFGKPDEIAELLAFCASDKPGYLTGVDILCDGGTKAGITLKDIITMARGSLG